MIMLIEAANAQLGGPPDVGLPKTPLPELIGTIINAALVLVGVLALGFLVYGGFLYITSAGDTDQIERAKKIITYAIIGIVVIGLAAAIVFFVVGAFQGGGGPGGGGGYSSSGGDFGP